MGVRRQFTLCSVLVLLAVSPWGFAGTIGLSWNPSVGASGYRVHYGPNPGQYTITVDAGNVTQVILQGPPDCADSFFAVTAYNAAGESEFSTEISSWPRPEINAVLPPSAMQGSLFTLDVNGMNFQPGTTVEIDNPNAFFDSPSVLACDQVQVSATVEPTAPGIRPAEVGSFSLSTTNPNQLTTAATPGFTVLVNPARFDIWSEPGPSQGRLDGRDTILLSRRFGSQEGDPLYDPDVDFDGNGWVDGNDLAYLGSNFGTCWTGSDWDASACPPSLESP